MSHLAHAEGLGKYIYKYDDYFRCLVISQGNMINFLLQLVWRGYVLKGLPKLNLGLSIIFNQRGSWIVLNLTKKGTILNRASQNGLYQPLWVNKSVGIHRRWIYSFTFLNPFVRKQNSLDHVDLLPDIGKCSKIF